MFLWPSVCIKWRISFVLWYSIVALQCCRVWSTTSKLLPQEGWLVVVVGRNHSGTTTSSEIVKRRLAGSSLVARQINFGSSRPLAFTAGLLLPIDCCSAVKNADALQLPARPQNGNCCRRPARKLLDDDKQTGKYRGALIGDFVVKDS